MSTKRTSSPTYFAINTCKISFIPLLISKTLPCLITDGGNLDKNWSREIFPPGSSDVVFSSLWGAVRGDLSNSPAGTSLEGPLSPPSWYPLPGNLFAEFWNITSLWSLRAMGKPSGYWDCSSEGKYPSMRSLTKSWVDGSEYGRNGPENRASPFLNSVKGTGSNTLK